MRKRKIEKFVILSMMLCTISLTGCSKPEDPTEIILTEPATQSEAGAFSPSESEAVQNSSEQDVTEETAIRYLLAQVPEIAAYHKMVEDYSIANNTPGNKPILRVDSAPNPSSSDTYEKNYYFIYVGETTDDHTNRWATFLVRQDLQEILVDDPITGQYIGLDGWRENNQQ